MANDQTPRVKTIDGAISILRSDHNCDGWRPRCRHCDLQDEAERFLREALALTEHNAREEGRREGAAPFVALLKHARNNNDHIYSHGGKLSPKYELGMSNDGPAVHADDMTEAARDLCAKLGLQLKDGRDG